MRTADDVLRAIAREREYQDIKWGNLEERKHSVAEWLLIMREEMRESEKAWCDSDGDDSALREILQAVAVGFACLQQCGIIERDYSAIVERMEKGEA